MNTEKRCNYPIQHGHYCVKPDGHVPKEHGSKEHSCNTRCEHVCPCDGQNAPARRYAPRVA